MTGFRNLCARQNEKNLCKNYCRGFEIISYCNIKTVQKRYF